MDANDINRGEALNLRHYWHIIMERRWLAIAIFLVFIFLTGIYISKSPNIYEGVVRIEIDREADNVVNFKDFGRLGAQEQDYLQTQYRNLTSRTMIEKVINKLHLDKDKRYADAKDLYKAVFLDFDIVPVRLSRLVDVKAHHPDREIAQVMANTLADLFVHDNLERKTNRTKEALDFLAGTVSTYKTNAAATEMKLQEFMDANNLVSIDEGKSIAQSALFAAQEAQEHAKTEASQAAAEAEAVRKLVANGTPKQDIPTVVQNKAIQDLKASVAAKHSVLATLLERYKEKHPDVKRARADLKAAEDKLREESDTVFESIQVAAQEAAAKLAAADRAVAEQVAHNQELNKRRIEMHALERDALANKGLYDSLLERMKQTEISENIKANNMWIVDPAQLPLKPVRPNKPVVITFGVLGGIFAAIMFALLVNYLDNAIKGQDDVESYLGLSFLGYVPHIETNNPLERDLEAHLHPTSSASEGFRTLRASVSLTNLPEKLRSIVVTSTAPAEGKSLVASNLAIVTAQAGLRTLLVEADLRRPSVHKTFQLHSPIGMATYLQNRVNSIDEIIHKTDVKDLEVVCCGAIPSNPSELIGSIRMTEFIREATKRYDRVVLDCPPISAVSDPLIVAAKADGLIFVAKFNKIRREYANKTVRRVQDAGIHILGAVINNIDFEGRDSYYYSQYYYQNRYYTSHYSSTDEKNPKEKEKIKS